MPAPISSTQAVEEAATLIGWREWVAFPAWGLDAIKAKIDTGARTSALHAHRIERYRLGGAPWVRFWLHPLQKTTVPDLVCNAEIIDQRRVSDSGGHQEQRLVIATQAEIGGHCWPIEITLTNRETMLFRMLLGRTAMRKRFLVNPARSFVWGKLSPEQAAARINDVSD